MNEEKVKDMLRLLNIYYQEYMMSTTNKRSIAKQYYEGMLHMANMLVSDFWKTKAHISKDNNGNHYVED